MSSSPRWAMPPTPPGISWCATTGSRLRPAEPFEPWWRQVLHSGLSPNNIRPRDLEPTLRSWPEPSKVEPLQSGNAQLEIVFRPDPTVYDGRYSNNAWLQELPKPLTKLTWDNAVMVSQDDAKQLNVATGDVVKLALGRARGIGAGLCHARPGAGLGHGALRLRPHPLGQGPARAVASMPTRSATAKRYGTRRAWRSPRRAPNTIWRSHRSIPTWKGVTWCGASRQRTTPILSISSRIIRSA